ncbi:hypothetical protein KKG83_01740 [Candidatus Micrarchaeota archaeon]|nr:hypothetical protein [Candidatus Micrarchaeota archaeon]
MRRKPAVKPNLKLERRKSIIQITVSASRVQRIKALRKAFNSGNLSDYGLFLRKCNSLGFWGSTPASLWESFKIELKEKIQRKKNKSALQENDSRIASLNRQIDSGFITSRKVFRARARRLNFTKEEIRDLWPYFSEKIKARKK